MIFPGPAVPGSSGPVAGRRLGNPFYMALNGLGGS
jgi:hypothetical protein